MIWARLDQQLLDRLDQHLFIWKIYVDLIKFEIRFICFNFVILDITYDWVETFFIGSIFYPVCFTISTLEWVCTSYFLSAILIKFSCFLEELTVIQLIALFTQKKMIKFNKLR